MTPRPNYTLPSGPPGAIARALGRRGYDEQIAGIFALDAMSRGRLVGLTGAEAIELVAASMVPVGVAALTELPIVPRLGAHRVNGEIRDTYQRSRKSWVIS